MRILHTADWHLGKTLEGRSRLEEQAAFLDELELIVREERIDLVLVAGDVYDTVNPPAAAEQLFYDGIARIADGGRRPVAVIAGNHDNPDRLAASDPLASRNGIHLLGLPKNGILKFTIASTGETVHLYALPYPSEARLNALLEAETDEQLLRQAYSARVAHLVAAHNEYFTPKTVNLLMSHLYVLGGMESESERPIQVGGAYTVDVSAFGSNVQYAALGHLHRPQMIKGQVPVRYSGSPIAYSFSESGQAKSVTIIEAAPGRPAEWREIPLTCGRPLVEWKATGGMSELYRWLEQGKDARAWIDLEIHVTDALTMDEIQTIRKQHSGIVHIRPVFPGAALEPERIRVASMSLEDMFRLFYAKQTGGAEPEEELVRLFTELVDDGKDSEAYSQEGGDEA